MPNFETANSSLKKFKMSSSRQNITNFVSEDDGEMPVRRISNFNFYELHFFIFFTGKK